MKKLLVLLTLLPVLLFAAPQEVSQNPTLQWTAGSGGPAVDHFEIGYGTVSGVYTTKVSTVTNVTTFQLQNIPVGTYFFNVRAFSTGGVPSAYDGEVQATVIVVPAPTGLKIANP